MFQFFLNSIKSVLMFDSIADSWRFSELSLHLQEFSNHFSEDKMLFKALMKLFADLRYINHPY